MMQLSLPAVAILLLSLPLSSQAQATGNPSYDVSIVRQSPSSSFGHSHLGITNGTLVGSGVDLRELIQLAFDIPRDQIFNLPAWVSDTRFDINAKDSTTDPALLKSLPEAKLQQMMQGLLADRFRLQSHTEIREVPAYELVFVRPSPALKLVDKKGGDLNIHTRHLKGKGIPIAQLLPTDN
jgi:uncharacterized protein (TIGR03435 family)